jgi:hypothetical protein
MAKCQCSDQVRKQLTVTEMCKAGLKEYWPKKGTSNTGLRFAQASIYSVFQKALHQKNKHV